MQLVKSLNAARKAAIAASSNFLTTAVSFPTYPPRRVFANISCLIDYLPVPGGLDSRGFETSSSRPAHERRCEFHALVDYL